MGFELQSVWPSNWLQHEIHQLAEMFTLGPFGNMGSAAVADDLLIESNVIIASPRIHNFNHTDLPIREQGGEITRINIGDCAWLGNGAVILNEVRPGVVIGAGAVVV